MWNYSVHAVMLYLVTMWSVNNWTTLPIIEREGQLVFIYLALMISGVSLVLKKWLKMLCPVWLFSNAEMIYDLWPISVYLTTLSPGGRGMNGNPVIIFPEFPAFGELEEDEVQNVLGYLTSVPRCLYPFI